MKHNSLPPAPRNDSANPQLEALREFRDLPEPLSSCGPSLRTSPEPCESDMQGHLVGASSAVSFLIHLQRRLRSTVDSPPQTSIFTFGDAKLPVFDETLFILPSEQEASMLIARYFEYASPTYRFLHRQTIEQWLQELYSKSRRTEASWHSKYAVLLTVFAQASRYMPSSSDRKVTDNGVEYFQAAERQLANEIGSVRLTSIQARLSQCLYLLTCSRYNHCWSLFGITSRLILAHGLHRKSSKFVANPNIPINYVDAECKKRLFWCAYNLDKYLSAILGRPSVFRDDEIDQEFPSIVDDDRLSPSSMEFASGGSYCMMIAPVAHVKLVQIVSQTLRDLYGIKVLKDTDRYKIIEELEIKVEAWKSELPAFLNPDLVDPRLLVESFRRQSQMLSLAYGHANMLMYRPCLLHDFKKQTDIPAEKIKKCVDKCLAAAMTIVKVTDRLVETNQLYHAFWFTHYLVFCAVVVFYTFTIRTRSDDKAVWTSYFQTAERCQSLITTVAAEDSIAHRFCIIMEEFRLEVIRQVNYQSKSAVPETIRTRSPLSNDSQAQSNVEPISVEDTLTWLSNNNMYESESAYYSGGLPNWEQLDSLALDFEGIFPELDLHD